MDQKTCLALWGLLAVLCFSRCTPSDVSLPPGFQTCSPNDPRFDQCLLEAAETDRKLLVNGYPALDIPPLNPINISHVEMDLRKPPVYSVSVKCDDIIVTYDFNRFVYINLDEDTQVFSLTVLFTILTFKGKYTAKGHTTFGNINSHGNATIIMGNTTAKCDASYTLVQKGGEDYMHLDTIEVQSEPKTFSADFGNIIRNPRLSKALTKTFNNNWESTSRQLLPQIEKKVGETLKEIIKGLFDNIPYRTLFPI